MLAQLSDVCVGISFLNVFFEFCQIYLSISFDVYDWFFVFVIADLHGVAAADFDFGWFYDEGAFFNFDFFKCFGFAFAFAFCQMVTLPFQ